MTTGKTIALTRWTFVSKLMCLLFNVLSRLVIAFHPTRSPSPHGSFVKISLVLRAPGCCLVCGAGDSAALTAAVTGRGLMFAKILEGQKHRAPCTHGAGKRRTSGAP